MPTPPSPTPTPSAFDVLSGLLSAGTTPQSLDQTHDLLKLLGIVLAQIALLTVVTDPEAEAAPKVSAARALLDLHESPESIAERLRRSPFQALTASELQSIVDKVRSGATIQDVLTQLKEHPDATDGRSHP